MDLMQNYYKLAGHNTLSTWDRASLLASDEWNFSLASDSLATRISNCLEHGTGVALIKNFPIQTNLDQTKAEFIEFVSRLGTPLPQNENAALIFSVEFRNESADERLNRGPINNDNLAFHSDRSDVTALLCCQPAASGGETKVVSSLRLHQELLQNYPDLMECLYQPFYYAKALWEKYSADDLVYPMPVFTVKDGHFACRYLRPLIDRAYANHPTLSLSSKQQAALAKLEELANHHLLNVELCLAVGDLLLINNHTTLHARNAFVDHADAKRLLLRSWLATPTSRPLHSCYLPLFGNCEAGTLRGGFICEN